MSDLTGTFTTTVVEHGLQLINDKPVAVLTFATGHKYFGYFTGEAAKYTTEALVRAGFHGTKVEQLNVEGAIDPTRKLEIVVESDTYEGKTRAKVRWINKVREKMTEKEVAISLGGLDLDAQLAAARAELGVKGVNVVRKTPLQTSVTTEDIAF
jgi:hypothetical protein